LVYKKLNVNYKMKKKFIAKRFFLKYLFFFSIFFASKISPIKFDKKKRIHWILKKNDY
tara:strand:+ start:2735 stop:2908 length:174 start_codon:yes stop_codon:yes gene_type:complete